MIKIKNKNNILTLQSVCKDSGSRIFIKSTNRIIKILSSLKTLGIEYEHYWQDFETGSSTIGTLFKGQPSDRSVVAKGKFHLEIPMISKNSVKPKKIIEVIEQ